MPVILLGRLPLPRLRTYVVFSLLLFACSYYYYSTQDGDARSIDSRKPEPDPLQIHMDANDETPPAAPGIARNASSEENIFDGGKTVKYLGVVNMAICCLILLVRGIQKIVFGELRATEHQHVRDKFWNFAFYKFIFIFGVMNVQSTDKIVLWCAWFGVLICLHLLAQLCKDRFEYLSFSPATPMKTHIKVLLLLFGIQAMGIALLAACCLVGYLLDSVNIFFFMAAEVILLMVKTTYVIIRYAIHLWDLHQDQLWENRSFYAYYTELVFELVALSIEFCNHLHMLIWSKILLNMASLVICMQLRYLFYELQRRYRRHKKRLRIISTMDEKFPMATSEEIEQLTDDCAICWERMETARKLPCGHFFHNTCLRSWLEQVTSCPICRMSLMDVHTPEQPHPVPAAGAEDTEPSPNLNIHASPTVIHPNFMTNHFFHFDGSRYVSWLPSFSVEVSHTQIMGNRQMATAVQTSQLDNMARQVQDVFPDMPMDTILGDLQLTRSVEHTIENIVEGRLQRPPLFPRSGADDSDSDVNPNSELDDFSSSTADVFSSTSRHQAAAADAFTSTGTVETSGEFYDTLSPSSPPQTLMFDTEHSVLPQQDLVCDDTQLYNLPNHGSRFSKSSSERESMLSQRKQLLLTQAKRRFLAKESRSKETVASSSDNDSSLSSGRWNSMEFSVTELSSSDASFNMNSIVRQRRERAFNAAVQRQQLD